jgi:hypothetical protein
MGRSVSEDYDNIWPSPWVLPIFSIVMSFICILLGYTILYTVYKHFRKNSHIDIKLAVCLTVMDMLTGFGWLIAGIANLPPLNLYSKYHNWCVSVEITGNTTMVASMNIIAVIALERCLLIVYNIKLKDWIYWLMVAACISMASINTIMVVVTDSIKLMASGVFCHYDEETYYGLAAHIFMFSFSTIAIAVLFVSYIKIVLFRYRLSQTQQLQLGLDPEKVKKETKRTAIKLITILCFNLGTITPYCIVQLMGLFNQKYFSPQVAFFVVPWTCMDIIWNSCLFLCMQQDIYVKWKETIGFKSS